MIASLVRFLFTCYEESQTHSFAALTCLESLGVVIGQNSALQWEGRERGEEKRFLTNSIYQLFQTPNPLQHPYLSILKHHFPSTDISFSQIPKPAKICLKNRYFEEQIHWMPLMVNKEQSRQSLEQDHEMPFS